MENTQAIEKMWQESLRGKFFAQVVCDVCRGSTRSTCSCVKAKFIASLTKDQIEKFVELQKNRK